MHDGQWIGVRSPEFREILDRIKVATRLSSELSAYCMDETESIRRVFEELIGKPVGDTFNLIPCRPTTGAASRDCHTPAGATVSRMYRDRTTADVGIWVTATLTSRHIPHSRHGAEKGEGRQKLGRVQEEKAGGEGQN